MDNDRLLTLLKCMSDTDEPMSSEKCASLLKMSVSSFKKSIPSFNAILHCHGAEIISKSGRGNGYLLAVNNRKKFEYFRDVKLLADAAKGAQDYNDQNNRVNHIAKKLLVSNDWMKSQEQADKMGISSSQFSKDMKLVRSLLDGYQIRVIDKPHYGLKAVGDEFYIRTCLAYLVTQTKCVSGITGLSKMDDGTESLDAIRRLVVSKCAEFDYTLNGLTLDNLVAHLYVAYHRVLNHQDITLDESLRSELRQDSTFPLAVSIVIKMQQLFKVEFPDDEVYYVIIHLSSKRIVKADSPYVTADVMNLVDAMLQRIMTQFHIDLTRDLNLRMMMATHTVPLLKRIEYHTTLSNPLMPEIRHRLLIAYDLALCCTSVINEKCGCDLSEDEVGYFALHIEVALNQKDKEIKKNILLVCATGRGSAQLLKNSFMDNYSQEIGSLSCCDVMQLQKIDLSGFDAIFTTVPLSLAEKPGRIPPIFQIDSLNGTVGSDQVKKLLASSHDVRKVCSYFRPEMFFTDIEEKDRSELIRQICRRINEVHPLPEGFAEAVLEREEMALTNFGGSAAFPHPNRIMTPDTFVSVCVLKKPVQWGNGKVQLILLSSFEKGFVRNNADVFRVISALISDKRYSEMLSNEPKYETLQRIIGMIC